MEKQLAACLCERQIAGFVQDDEVETGEIIGEPPLTSGASFRFKAIDESDSREEAATRAGANAAASDGDCEMSFARARSADQYDVTLLSNKVE